MPKIPNGGLVLVTGASGYLAGVLIQLLLDRGYHVRGTVRSVSKSEWMLSHYGKNFSLIEIPDMAADHAFDEAVKGVDGIAAVASPTSHSEDPEKVITPAVKGTLNLLAAAFKEARVKRFVLTSSSSATSTTIPGQEHFIGKDTWNQAAIDTAWTPSDDQSVMRRIIVYAASKTETEMQAFEWVKENKPHFSFNTVIPSFILGKLASPKHTGFSSSMGMLHSLFYGNAFTTQMPAHHFVDVEDSALLHIAALTQVDVQNERLFAIGGMFSWNAILDVFRKLHPERKFLDDVVETPDLARHDPALITRAEELLGRLEKTGFTNLEDTLRKAVEDFVSAENESAIPPSSVDIFLANAHSVTQAA